MKIKCRIENGNKIWRNEKCQIHRKNGPAIVRANVDKEWWQNDKLHRIDGPAVEFNNGTKYWWVDGIRYSEKEFNELTGKLDIDIKITINGKQYKLVLID